jgi:hypothetical protein
MNESHHHSRELAIETCVSECGFGVAYICLDIIAHPAQMTVTAFSA